jgi:hypothetical protein
MISIKICAVTFILFKCLGHACLDEQYIMMKIKLFDDEFLNILTFQETLG